MKRFYSVGKEAYVLKSDSVSSLVARRPQGTGRYFEKSLF
jgi:hypothetical protein